MTSRLPLLTLAAAALLAACGTESSRVPTAPPVSAPAPPAPAPAPTPPEGTWAGTFVSGNWSFSPFPITVTIRRSGDRIKGTWYETVWLDLGGEIDGTLDDTAFDGKVSVNGCWATFRGTLTATAGELTSPGMSGCSPIFPSVPNPVDIKFQLSR